jgi:hypothetical protein
MILAIRRGIAVLAAFGLAAGVSVYVGSYMGLTMEAVSRWAIVLHVGVFILFIPMCLQNYNSLSDRSFFWSNFSKGRPKWVVPTIKWIGLFFFIHLLLFFVESRASAPQIKDGQYVLDDHGQIKQVLNQREYLHLKGAELRLFAAGWMSFYVVLLFYWWLPRFPERADRDAFPASEQGRFSQ